MANVSGGRVPFLGELMVWRFGVSPHLPKAKLNQDGKYSASPEMPIPPSDVPEFDRGLAEKVES